MQFQKGHVPWTKGKTRSKETRKKISEALKKTTKTAGRFEKGHTTNNGRKVSKETKEKMSLAHKGVKKSAEHCKNISKAKSGKNAWNWSGGRIYDRYGYVHIKNPFHPNTSSKGYVPEHRLVMEDCLGRYLTRKEVVHHINKVKDDNRIENLHLFKNNVEHLKYHRDPENYPFPPINPDSLPCWNA